MIAGFEAARGGENRRALTTGSPRAKPEVIVGLDLIRFAAALMVVIYHFAHRTWAPPVESASIRRLLPGSPAFPELEPLAWTGWVGVEIFFVISGFVIANSAEHSSPFVFLRSRIVRLAPAIWVCATITFAVYCAIRGIDGSAVRQYLRSVAIPLFPEGPWIDSVYWTLVVEITFYALVLLLLAADSFKRLDWLLVALAVVSGGLWVAWALTGVGEALLTSGLGQILLFRHGCFFAVGIALWLLSSKRVTALRLSMLLLALTGCLIEIHQLSEAKVAVIGRDLSALSVQAVFLAGVALIVASVRFNGRLTRLIGGSTKARAVGLMTYPLYLIHNIVGVALINVLMTTGMDRWGALGGAVLAMIALAWAISRTGEPWIAALLRRLFSMIEGTTRTAPSLQRLFQPTKPVPA